jgi:hypothetical protein
MNVQSFKLAFTTSLRPFIATLIAGLLIITGGNAWSASATVSIVDTLGAATPDTTFNIFGSGGQAVLFNQFPGPKFTLTQPTTLTEIGGFLNNCGVIVMGIPQCPATLPFIVQIRPATNGVPDASTVLATFVLSHDNEPLIVSYESVAINLSLQPGSYFALFAPQGTDAGFLLGSALDPFQYQAGLIEVGFLDPTTGNATLGRVPVAVRILGETNVVIGGCDSGVPDMVLPGDFSISDLVAECSESATNHGQFVSCISHVTNDLMKAQNISGLQKSALQTCAAQADIP